MAHQADVAPILSEDTAESTFPSADVSVDADSGRLETLGQWRRNWPSPSVSACPRTGVKVAVRFPLDPSSESTLSLYLRDLGALQLMDADEELRAVQAVERAEIEHWVALLSYLPTAERVLDLLNAKIQSLAEDERLDVPQIGLLRGLARLRGTQQTLAPQQQRDWDELSRELARAVRLPDLDRLWVADANALVRNVIRQEPGTRQQDGSDPSTYQDFLQRVRQTDLAQKQAKHRIVGANLRLVVSIARQCGRGCLPLIDVIQEGNIGLMQAVERFDPRRGHRFTTFAFWWIRHAISRAVAYTGRVVRIPMHTLAACNRALRVTESLVARTGREPTREELEQHTRISGKKLSRLKNLDIGEPLSLDREVGDEPGRCFLDFLADDDSANPCERLALQRQNDQVRRLLETLPPVESRIIRWRFGFDDEDELSLREIGERYQLTHEAIRRRLEKTLRKIRRKMDRF